MTINTLCCTAAAAAALLAAAAGCGRPGNGSPAAADGVPGAGAAVAQAARASAGSGGAEPGGLVAGTPAGGLEGWIGEVRAGLAGMPELAERDPAAAKNRALQLYVTRQEYIEMYYGTAGRAVRDTELAEAVVTAESRFHELLRVLNPPDGRVDVRAVGPAAGALRDQYDLVLQRARQLGLDARRLRLPAGGAP